MFKFVLLSAIALFSLHARENPFFPSDDVKAMPVTSNNLTTFEPLKRATISLPDSARVIEKVTIQYKNLDGSVSNKSIELGQSIDWHLPIFVSQSFSTVKEKKAPKLRKKIKKSEALLAQYKFIKFYDADGSLLIKTKDKLIRSFMLPSPHRIILDFKRDADFRSYETKINKKPYTRLRIGNHSGYYRVVIELDGQYHYKKRVAGTSVTLTCF